MIKSVIVDTGSGFCTYSGWVIDRTDEYLVLAAIGEPGRDPEIVALPTQRIVTDGGIAA